MGMGFGEARDVSTTKHSFCFPTVQALSRGLLSAPLRLLGAFSQALQGFIDYWTNGDTAERSCYPPGLAGKIIPTRGPLAYTITYCIFPSCYGLHR